MDQEIQKKNPEKTRGTSHDPTPRPCRTLLTAEEYAGAPGACALPGVRSAKPASPTIHVRHSQFLASSHLCWLW